MNMMQSMMETLPTGITDIVISYWITSAMTTQAHHNVKYSMNEKEQRALTLFIESVLKPDPKLRACAHNQECYAELMDLREEVLSLLYKKQKQKCPTL